MVGVRALYEDLLLQRGYSSDPAQIRGIEALERCEQAWSRYKHQRGSRIKRLLARPDIPRGVYLHGGVGRGKSLLMDCFFQSVPLQRKTRLHFHEFMREVHRELKELQGTVNPLDELGTRIAKRFRLICFDEFHVADVTDAMILHRLLQAIFDRGVGVVTTSNFKPDDLYPNGLHRDRILPAIELLKERMEVVEVDGGNDYRQLGLLALEHYWCPLGAHAQQGMTQAFERLAEARDEDPVIHIDGREFRAQRRAGGVIWFDFKALCGTPRSQNDYLEIATRFHTILLSDVPKMSEAMASEARRFTWLIDVLYDRRVQLIMSAQVSADQLYVRGPLSHEFPRTVSRLTEMRTAEFARLERRNVDTSLT
jgi:cell division protein ZapE